MLWVCHKLSRSSGILALLQLLLCIAVRAAAQDPIAVQNVSNQTRSFKLEATQPAAGASDVQLSEFSILFQFNNPVRVGEGNVSVESGVQPFVTVHQRTDCRGLTAIGRYVILPILSVLAPLRPHTVTAAGSCFADASTDEFFANGASIEEVLAFTTSRRGQLNLVDFDFTPPALLSPHLVEPQPNGWLLGMDMSIVMYFTERVQAGATPVRFRRLLPGAWHIPEQCADPQLQALLDASDEFDVNITFDEEIPGKVVLEPTEPLHRSAAYELLFDPAIFVDVAGNFFADSVSSVFGLDRLVLKVPTFVASAFPPFESLATSGNNLVLHFEDDVLVTPGAALEMCEMWPTVLKDQEFPGVPDPDPAGDGCLFKYPLPVESLIKLGARVLVLLPNLTEQITYSIHIHDSMFDYFENSSLIDANGRSKLSFEIGEPNTDVLGPRLFGTYLGCAGRSYVPPVEAEAVVDEVIDEEDGENYTFVSNYDDGEPREPSPPSGWFCNRTLVSTEDFVPLESTVPCDCGVLKLLFEERVLVGNGSSFMQSDRDETFPLSPEVLWDYQWNSWNPLVSTSVLTYDLGELALGTAYTVRVAERAVTDQAPRMNPNQAATFHFVRPMPSPSVYPANGAKEVEVDTAIKLQFEAVPRFSEDAEIILRARSSHGDDPLDLRHVLLNAFSDQDAKLLTQGAEVLILFQSQHPLIDGVTYDLTFSEGAVLHMPDGFHHTFSTRLKDTVPPAVLFTFPWHRVGWRELAHTALLVIFTEGVLMSERGEVLLLEDGHELVSFREEHFACSFPTSPCMVLDETSTRLTLYPSGQMEPLNSWARIGCEYTLHFPHGSFSDAATVRHTPNDIEPTELTFHVDGDELGPLLVDSSPMNGTIGLDPFVIDVVLEFDEAVVPSKSTFAVRAWHETRAAPKLIYTLDSMSISPAGMLVALAFDTAVQAGFGTIALFSAWTGEMLGRPSDVRNVTFKDNKMLYMPDLHGLYTDDLVNEEVFVRASSEDAIVSVTGDSSPAPLDTKELQTLVVNGTDMDLVHSTLAEFACLSAAGLPDIELFMNQGIGGVRTSQSEGIDPMDPKMPPVLAGKRVWLYECDGYCSSTNDMMMLWELVADEDVTDALRIRVEVEEKPPFNAVLKTSELPQTLLGSQARPLRQGAEHMIVIEGGMFLSIPPVTREYDELGPFETFQSIPSASSVLDSIQSATSAEVLMSVDSNEVDPVVGPVGPAASSGPSFASSGPVFSSGGFDDEIFASNTMDDDYYGEDDDDNALMNMSNTTPLLHVMGIRNSLPRGDQQSSPHLRLSFRTCKVEYVKLRPDLVHLYAPFSSRTGAKRFQVLVPSTAIRDTMGNHPEDEIQFVTFAHEAEPPELEINGTYPIDIAGPRDNIILTFSEPVRLGAGYFAITSDSGPSFQIDVTDLIKATASGPRLLMDNQVLLPLRTHCRDPPCDLEPGHRYTVTTSHPGTVLDMVGNRLQGLNLGGYGDALDDPLEQHAFRVAADPNDDPPFVVFASGSEFDESTMRLKAYVFFNKFVQPSHDRPVLLRMLRVEYSLQTLDNSTLDEPQEVVNLVDAVEYGRGERFGGGDEYGLISFTATLPATNTRYEAVLLADGFADGTSGHRGPQSDFTYFLDVGLLAPGNREDTTPPTLRGSFPANGERGVPTLTNITLIFDEHVQGRNGLVRFCLNADAVADDPRSCIPARFADNMEAVFDVSHAMVTGFHELTFVLPKPFAPNQVIHVVIPVGAIVDDDIGENSMEPVEESALIFYLIERDVQSPELAYMIAPRLAKDNLTLVFSEAVQVARPFVEVLITLPEDSSLEGGDDGSTTKEPEIIFMEVDQLYDDDGNDTDFNGSDFDLDNDTNGSHGGYRPPVFWSNPDIGTSTAAPPSRYQRRLIPWRTHGNVITIHPDWIPGAWYDFDWDAVFHDIMDLDANLAVSPVENVSTAFGISADIESARVAWGDGIATRLIGLDQRSGIHMHATLTVEFDEEVRPGSGNITIEMESLNRCGSMHIDVSEAALLMNVRQQRQVQMAIFEPPEPLLPGVTYHLVIPPEAFVDLAGNLCLTCAEMLTPLYMEMEKDTRVPTLNAVGISSPALPDPAVDPLKPISLHFSEAVWFGGALSGAAAPLMYLEPSNGGHNCAVRGGTCPFGDLPCTAPCRYQEANETIPIDLAAVQILGSKAIIQVDGLGLQPGGGYKLRYDAGYFADLEGNRIAAFDGEDGTDGIVAVWQVAALPEDDVGPVYVGSPLHGQQRVASTALIELNFDEDLMPGPGVIKIMQVEQDTMKPDKSELMKQHIALPAETCHFAGSTVYCIPSERLQQNATYEIELDEDFAMDRYGNFLASRPQSSNSSYKELMEIERPGLSFQIIDMDTNPPVLMPETMVHLNGSIAVPKAAVVVLQFDTEVQIGDGVISFVPCAVEAREHRCNGEVDAAAAVVDVNVNGPGVTIGGSSVFISHEEFMSGTRYLMQIDSSGVFKDMAGNLFEADPTDFEFSTIVDDDKPPRIIMTVPQNSTEVAEASQETDILLYFTEPVRPVQGQALVSDVVVTIAVPVDNSDVLSGVVTVDEHEVRINPFQELSSGRIVTVEVDPGAFVDRAGNEFRGLFEEEYQFRTTELRFYRITPERPLSSASMFSQREGQLFVSVGTSFMIFGGNTRIRCLNDVWRSENGINWTQVSAEIENVSMPLPRVAYSAYDTNSQGCVLFVIDSAWCTIEDPVGRDRMWMTCDMGSTWFDLPDPVVAPVGPSFPPIWPTNWTGHSMVFVGGWQLVIVDAARESGGGVWGFLDIEYEVVQLIAEAPLPFGRRWSPHLATTSDAQLLLLGGLGGPPTEEVEVFNDLWVSYDSGATWRCLSAHFTAGNSDASSQPLDGMGKFAMFSVLSDDSLFLVGGESVASLFLSALSPWDTSFSFEPLLQVPTMSLLRRHGQEWALYFSENITVDKEDLRLEPLATELGQGPAPPAPVNARAVGQVLYISPIEPLQAGRTYGLAGHDGFVADLNNNSIPILGGDAEYHYTITVDPDDVPVHIVDVFPMGNNAAPWTLLRLIFSEDVVRGPGAIELHDAGHEVVPLHMLELQSTVAVFTLPPSTSRLTEGMRYRIFVAPGAFSDPAGNVLQSGYVGNFTVMSGSFSLHFSDWAVRNRDLLSPSPFNFSSQDNEPPVFLHFWPPFNATDVPYQYSNLRLQWFFNEEVRFTDLGNIRFKNLRTGQVIMYQSIGDASLLREHPASNALLAMTFPEELRQPNETVEIKLQKRLVEDLAGNRLLLDVTTNITFASGSIDNAPPRLLLQYPSEELGPAPGSTSHIDLYFSEEIELAECNITLASVPENANRRRRPAAEIRTLVIAISPDIWPCETSCSVEVLGPLLRLNVAPGFLEVEGQWSFDMPSGCVQDLRRYGHTDAVSEGGGNIYPGHIAMMDIIASDVEPPTLVEAYPHHERRATHELPQSVPVLLTFSEPVRAIGHGMVRLEPLYWHASPMVEMWAVDGIVEGSQVVYFPGDLTPGQVYHLTIEPNSFQDMAGNNFTGLMSTHRFSTAPIQGMQMVNDRRRRRREFRRYAGSLAVDSSNNVYLSGGRLDDPEDPLQLANPDDPIYLNDVWQLQTGRATHCASSFMPHTRCSARQCILGMDGSPPTLGTAVREKLVWRSASLAGDRCVGLDGQIRNALGMLVDITTVTCPCPTCISPPAAPSWRPLTVLEKMLPDFMVNTTYVNEYSLISAAQGQAPLLCEQDREPDGDFTCVVDTEYYGKFKVPYPSCSYLRCRSPPAAENVQNFAEYVPATSTDGIDCADISADLSMEYAGNCSFKCAAGFLSDGHFTCNKGEFTTPSCSRQRCDRYDFPNGFFDCPDMENPMLGSVCNVRCDAGYLSPVTEANCTTLSSEPEVIPSLSPNPSCRRSSCGDYMFTEGAVVTYLNTRQFVGTNATVECMDGYQASFLGLLLMCSPVLNEPGNPEVEWRSAVTGRLAGPSCVPVGQDITEIFKVVGVITMITRLADFCDGSRVLAAGFSGLQNAISAGMTAGGTFIVADAVEDVALDICQQRRLQAMDGGLANEVNATLDYGVVVQDSEVAQTLVAQVSGTMGNSVFAMRFADVLLALGLQVRDVVVENPRVSISFATTEQLTPASSTQSTTSQLGNGGGGGNDWQNDGSEGDDGNAPPGPGFLVQPRDGVDGYSHRVAFALALVSVLSSCL